MDMRKIKEWMEFANQCGKGDFWEQFMDDNEEGNPQAVSPAEWIPPVDIVRTSDEIVILAELPGIRKDELDLTITGDSLLIRGIKNNRFNIEDTILCERYTGTFERCIRLPYPVEWSAVSAKLAEGMLVIRFPVPPCRENKLWVD